MFSLKKLLFERKKKSVENLSYESTNGCPFVECLFCSNSFYIYQMFNGDTILQYRNKHEHNCASLGVGLIVYKIHYCRLELDVKLSNSNLQIQYVEDDTLVYGSYEDFYSYFKSTQNEYFSLIPSGMHGIKKLFDDHEKVYNGIDTNLTINTDANFHVINYYNKYEIQYICFYINEKYYDELITSDLRNHFKTFYAKKDNKTYHFVSYLGDIKDLIKIAKTGPELKHTDLSGFIELFFDIDNSSSGINDEDNNIESNDQYYSNIDEIIE